MRKYFNWLLGKPLSAERDILNHNQMLEVS